RGLGFQGRLGLADLLHCCLACGIQRRIALRIPLLYASLSRLVDLAAGLAQPLGILGCQLLGLGNGLVRLLLRALGTGAAFFERGRQWSLNQKLVGQNQHREQQYCGYGAKQKRPELLNEYLHADSACSDCPGGLMDLSRAGEHFFVSRANRQVNESGPYFGTSVTAVTIWDKCSKKNLLLSKTSLN